MHVLRRKAIFAAAMNLSVVGLNAFGLIAFGLPARAAEFNPAQKAEIEATIHAHPTLSDAVHEATGQAFGHAIHI